MSASRTTPKEMLSLLCRVAAEFEVKGAPLPDVYSDVIATLEEADLQHDEQPSMDEDEDGVGWQNDREH